MYCGREKVPLFLLIIFFFGTILPLDCGNALACSRVLSADNGQAVLVGRNFDWPVDTGTELWVFPRGMKRSGLVKNPLTWTSKYGSLAVVSFLMPQKGGVADGMNEKGLAANTLWLDKSDYGARNDRLPGLSVIMWAQYFLDNFATVDEAVRSLKEPSYQLVTLNVSDGRTVITADLHLSLEDRTGDSAIIEYVGGKLIVHHDRNYTVMTNEPPFEKQLENLRQYEGFGGNKPLPGTTQPQDRFVRASYYLKYLPKPHNRREAIAGVFSVTRNVSQPFNAYIDPQHPNTSATLWRVVADLTHDTYYFESTTSPNVIWVELNQFDLKEGSPCMKLDLRNNPDFSGDVTKQFVEAKPFEFVH